MPGILLLMTFLSDPEVITTTREVFSLIDALAQIGGVLGITLTIIRFFIKDIQAILFHSHLARKAFLIDENQG
jgi:hypothetical protein